MRNIKKSAPYKTSDKSYYQPCLQETYKIFLDISKVIISNDIVINRNAAPLSDSLTILSEQKRFYQNLYMSGRDETDNRYAAKSFLNNLNIPKLSEEEKQSCEDKILFNESELILEAFQNNKAPGDEGIPVEF